MSLSFQVLTNITKTSSAWNMLKYGLCLIRIFPYMDRIIPYFPVFGQNLLSCPNTGKYGLEKARIHHFSRSAQIYVVVVLEMPL